MLRRRKFKDVLTEKSVKCFYRNLGVNGCPSKENLFLQSALLMNVTTYTGETKVIYKFME